MNYISSVLVLKMVVFAAGDGAIFRNQLKCKNCNTLAQSTRTCAISLFLACEMASTPIHRIDINCNAISLDCRAEASTLHSSFAHSKWMRCVIGVICIRSMQNTPIALEFSGSATGTSVSLCFHSAVSRTVSRRT